MSRLCGKEKNGVTNVVVNICVCGGHLFSSNNMTQTIQCLSKYVIGKIYKRYLRKSVEACYINFKLWHKTGNFERRDKLKYIYCSDY